MKGLHFTFAIMRETGEIQTVISVFILIFFGQLLLAQKNLPVTWKTDHDIVDSGYLARLPINLYDNYELVFYKDSKERIVIDQKNVEWVYQGDTLLTRQSFNGRSQLMRLLYQGDIRLYRTIQSSVNRQYYLVRGNQWELLGHLEAREVGYKIIQQNCPDFKPEKRLRSDHQAIEVARQLNNCIGAYKHHSLPTYNAFKHQFGIVANIPGKKNSRADDRYQELFNVFNSSGIEKWPIYAPIISLSYQYSAFRHRPKLSVQINTVFLHIDREIISNLHYPQPAYRVKESLDITSLYLYPGLHFSTGHRRSLQFTIGAGPILVLPIKARRQINLLDETAVPILPIAQEFNNIIDPGIGYYLQLGMRFRLCSNIHISLTIRGERLRQSWRYYQFFNDNNLYSEAFPHHPLLAKGRVSRFQATATYSW